MTANVSAFSHSRSRTIVAAACAADTLQAQHFRPGGAHLEPIGSAVTFTALAILPYALAFYNPEWPTPTWMTVIDVLADVIFLVDVGLNFNTAYVRAFDATLITNKKAIARNYLSGWFAKAVEVGR